MKRDELLKTIAETGYNVGIGAKKHFATYDIVDKVPGLVSFVSFSVGIMALAVDTFAGKTLAATMTVLGVMGLYIQWYESQKEKYCNTGIQLTQLLNRLRDLYRSAKECQDSELAVQEIQLKAIEKEFYDQSIPNQILFSDWYAHYKFFWQHQIDWIDEQKHFSLLRDKIPLSAYAALFLLAVMGVVAWWSQS